MIKGNRASRDPSFMSYMSTISKIPVLSREDEDKLARQYVLTKSAVIADKLIKANLRFVAKVAYKYSSSGYEMMDLIQEGNHGLVVALDKFEPDRGHRFITYAVWWIKAHIKKYVMENHSQLKIGTTHAQRNLYFGLRSAKAKLESQQDEVTVEDLAELLGEDIKDIESMELRLAQRDASLQAPISNTIDGGDSCTIQDTLEDKGLSQLDIFEQKQTINKVTEILSTLELNPREKRLLEVRLTSNDPQTLQSIGKEFGISRERVRQIETKLISRVREVMKEESVYEDMHS